MQRDVQNPLAMAILRGEFHDGDAIEIDVEGGKVVFADGTAEGAASATSASAAQAAEG